jgi:hypothetical protein
MCTYATVQTALQGSAKGPDSSWFHVTDGTIYFDHPVHAMAEHTLNIDFADPARGPAARVAVELTAASARELVAAIQTALDQLDRQNLSARDYRVALAGEGRAPLIRQVTIKRSLRWVLQDLDLQGRAIGAVCAGALQYARAMVRHQLKNAILVVNERAVGARTCPQQDTQSHARLPVQRRGRIVTRSHLQGL